MTWLRTAVLSALLAAACTGAWALDVRFQRVADGVYAHIGDTGGRSEANEGLNANIGLVVTRAGALLIDTGATLQSARQIHQAVKAVTAQPVKWVFNTGGQDHRWLGNGYFAAQGAEVIAHASAKADGTVPTLPTRWLAGNASRTYLEMERE